MPVCISLSVMSLHYPQHLVCASLHFVIRIVITQILAKRGIVNQRIPLPADLQIKIIERIFPLVRQHNVSILSQERWRIEPTREHRLARTHDVELVHQGNKLLAFVGHALGIGHIQHLHRIRARAVNQLGHQHRVQAELDHVVVWLHHRQTARRISSWLVHAAVRQMAGTLFQKNRAPHKRHRLRPLPAQHFKIRLADVRHLRHHPDGVVTLVDK